MDSIVQFGDENPVTYQHMKKILIGALIGGLVGAGAILVLAAQSAKQAQAGIRRRGSRWLERATLAGGGFPARGRVTAGGRTAGNMTVHVS